jgi:hypothetical protein
MLKKLDIPKRQPFWYSRIDGEKEGREYHNRLTRGKGIPEESFRHNPSSSLFIVDVADAAEKMSRFPSDISHPVGFHARHKNGRSRTA